MQTPKDTLLRIEDLIGVSKKVNGQRKRKLVQRGLLNMSRSALYAAISRGELPPPVKIGRSSFWRESEIQAAIGSMGGGRSMIGKCVTLTTGNGGGGGA